jgi:hypothetical protein
LPAASERDSTGELASGAEEKWLGGSIWKSPKIEIARIKSWPSIGAMSYHGNGQHYRRSTRANGLWKDLSQPAGGSRAARVSLKSARFSIAISAWR